MRPETLRSPLPTPLDPRLRILSSDPLNAETPLSAQTRFITPNALHYVRSHGATPRIVRERWRLSVSGEVKRPLVLSYAELRSLPARSRAVTLECAGNSRAFLHPPAPGEPWGHGAVSTAEWTGIPLHAVLSLAEPTPRACEVVFTGADVGAGSSPPFARSLPIEKAMDADTLLAFGMNGEALPPHHGFPVRLIVPSWYAVASVKWLVSIEVVARPFDGFYQTERYVLSRPRSDGLEVTPLTTMRPESFIAAPADGAVVPRGQQRVTGFAWSGAAPVTRVEVSADAGTTWQEASFTRAAEPFAWRPWEYIWDATPGVSALQSRASDAAGNTQPVHPDFNRLGYANNAIQWACVTVR